MNCQARVGLLVLRVCGEPAIGVCSGCGTPVCFGHQVMGAAGAACPDCAASQQDLAGSEQAQESERRKSYYSEFGDADYFTRADHAAVNNPAAGIRRVRSSDYDPLET